MCISTDGKDAGWHLETGLLTQLEVIYSLYLWGEREGYKCFILLLLYLMASKEDVTEWCRGLLEIAA